MAKKNSSKTATEKSISNSEPKLLQVKGWTGIDLRNVPDGWTPGERGWDAEGCKGDSKFNQTDERVSYLLLQNNVVTTPEMTLETRPVIRGVHGIPKNMQENLEYTGVACIVGDIVFMAVKMTELTFTHNFPNFSYSETHSGYGITFFSLVDSEVNGLLDITDMDNINPVTEDPYTWPVFPDNVEPTEIGFFEKQLIVLTSAYEIYTGELTFNPDGTVYSPPGICSAKRVDNPAAFSFWRESDDPDEWFWDNNIYIGPHGFVAKWEHDIPEGEPNFDATGTNTDWTWPNAWKNYPNTPLYMTNVNGEIRIYEGEVVDPGTMKHTWSREYDLVSTRLQIYYSFSNRFGTTVGTGGNTTIDAEDNEVSDIFVVYTDLQPLLWSPSQYMDITINVPPMQDITGVDIYASVNEGITPVFIGHMDVRNETNDVKSFTYEWHGGLDDTSQWSNVPLDLPQENTTKGAPCQHFTVIDSRLYFWGSKLLTEEGELGEDAPWRVYIGGNPGSELSIARGLGGAWVDIEPGSGIYVSGLAKWKTVSGASIVTVLCGNINTTRVKRFNLLETTISVTNEISQHGYMYEEVPNVIGCNSRWGYGVFQDGLYAISRYGLMVTTMAMEYNSQMRAQKVSGNIDPVFTSRLGKRIDDARLVHIDGTVFIALAEERDSEDKSVSLDHVIMCYAVDEKAWYTISLKNKDRILHILPIDYEGYVEGLGIITNKSLYLYPTVDHDLDGAVSGAEPPYTIVETHEIAGSTPAQGFLYVQQFEMRFDYFYGEADVVVEGVDYYGRPFHIYKKMRHSEEDRNVTEWIRVEKYVEFFRVLIKGNARYRCTHWLARVYSQSKRINNVYGYDEEYWYTNRSGGKSFDHHRIDDYNDLKRAIVP